MYAEHVARKRIVRQVITALRKDAQQRTAKTQRYADYLHQRSLFVQEKDRYQKDPNGLHGVEDGTGNRSRLTDAQQIAEQAYLLVAGTPPAEQHTVPNLPLLRALFNF